MSRARASLEREARELSRSYKYARSSLSLSSNIDGSRAHLVAKPSRPNRSAATAQERGCGCAIRSNQDTSSRYLASGATRRARFCVERERKKGKTRSRNASQRVARRPFKSKPIVSRRVVARRRRLQILLMASRPNFRFSCYQPNRILYLRLTRLFWPLAARPTHLAALAVPRGQSALFRSGENGAPSFDGQVSLLWLL